MFVCVFSIEIETAGRIWMKFGRELVLKGGGKVLGGLVGVGHLFGPQIWAPCLSGAMVTHYEEELIKPML